MTSPFSRTALWVIVPIAIVSLVVAIALSLFGDDLTSHPSAGADAYSRSAIGHRGLVEMLRALDRPVEVSRADSAAKAKDGVLVLFEPSVPTDGGVAAGRLRAMIASAPRSLVVLPKWSGLADTDDPWVAKVLPKLPLDIRGVLDALGVRADVQGLHGRTSHWDAGDFADTPPELDDPQTMAGPDLEPMISAGDDDEGRALLAKTTVDGHEVWILSDPDILDNAGLRRGANARLAVAILDGARKGGPIIFDESTHGYAETPSLWHALIRFPLVLSTAQFAVCAILIAWAAMVRFGPRRAAPPPIAPGKDFLIRNTAALLRHGGHHGHALRRYLATTTLEVRAALHAPELEPAAATAWLERVRLARGGAISLDEIEAEIAALPRRPSPQKIVVLADRVHRWRMEMTHGTDHHP
jgi:hypothetical protein